jgi:hypothetical protein
MGLPLDLSKYYQSPLGQLGRTPSFVPEDLTATQDTSDAEDYADEYGGAGYSPVISRSATVAAGPRQKSAAELRSQQDYDQLRAAIATAPQATSPKWWQRAAGAAAGFGAGWSNAAGRTRNPIDIGAMQENILNPGYRQKLEQWQSRVGPLQQIAGLDQSQVEQERRTRQTDIQEEWNKARAEGEHQRGLMWAARARAYDQGKIGGKAAAPTTQDLLNNVAEIEKSLGRKLDPWEVEYYVLNKGSMSGFGPTLANQQGKGDSPFNLAPGQKRYDAAGKVIAENNDPRPVDPAAQLSRLLQQQALEQRMAEAHQKMFLGIQGTKDATEDKIRKERETLLKPVLSKYLRSSEKELYDIKDPVRKAAALAALQGVNQTVANRLQSAQDSYARAIREAGGSADDFDIDPLTLKATRRKPK